MELKEMYLNEYRPRLNAGRLVIPRSFSNTYEIRMGKEMEEIYGVLEEREDFQFYSFYEDDFDGRERLEIKNLFAGDRVVNKRVSIPLGVRRGLGLGSNDRVLVQGFENSFSLWNLETFRDYISNFDSETFREEYGKLLELSRTSRL